MRWGGETVTKIKKVLHTLYTDYRGFQSHSGIRGLSDFAPKTHNGRTPEGEAEARG